jgi:hypothetical protein
LATEVRMSAHPHLCLIALLGAWGSIFLGSDASGQDAGSSGAILANPLAAHSLDGLSATRDRPLFSPSRRPPPPPPVLAAVPSAPAAPAPPPSFVLFGIVSDDSGPRAVLRGSGKIVRVRLGDEIEGWRVTEIEARHLVLSHDERSVTIALFAGSGANGADRIPVGAVDVAAQNRIQALTDRRSGRH